ncbi:uncharacterized protein Dmoj_GI26351 [Drosophila mojavensis]|uniref:Uncharacterized protein n=2 Tax=Drosophila mojavensis TaxID=7230 RepID=A0A0Q9WZZ1_DROMO|nr:uncharacterized protein Dmoj_GI26351 [Drosophila mojavensis]
MNRARGENQQPRVPVNDVLYVLGNNMSFTKQQYCWFPFKKDYKNREYSIGAKVLPLPERVNIITFSADQALRALSVFCLVLTIAVFLYVKKYKTMYNRCYMCYFTSLTISFF